MKKKTQVLASSSSAAQPGLISQHASFGLTDLAWRLFPSMPRFSLTALAWQLFPSKLRFGLTDLAWWLFPSMLRFGLTALAWESFHSQAHLFCAMEPTATKFCTVTDRCLVSAL